MSSSTESDEQERKLFVGGFDKTSADEEQLKTYFEQYGDVVDCNILRDGENQSRGFGFVLFGETSTVEKIMKEKKDGTSFSLNGHNMEVKRALPKAPRGATVGTSRTGGAFRKVFVGGLPSSITEQDLRTHFETYGPISEIELVRDHETNRLRGFAFIGFEDEDSADKCLVRRNHEICKKVCEVKRAQNRAKRSEDDDRSGRRSNGYDNRDDPRQHRPAYNGVSGVAPSGNLGAPDLNQIIQQAFLLGQQSGLTSVASPLANLRAMTAQASQPSNILLQALSNQLATQPAPPVVAPVIPAAAPATSSAALTQIAQLIQSGGVDPNALASLLKGETQRKTEQLSPTSPKSKATYSTTYPLASSYDSARYGYKDEERKRAYRPY